MTDTLLERHAEALRLFGERVRDVRGDQWGAPTPCTEWNVRELVNHVTAEQLWIPPLVSEGRTVEELAGSFSGDVLGEDPVAAWDRPRPPRMPPSPRPARWTGPSASRTGPRSGRRTARS